MANWFAVQKDRYDTDWGFGSFNWDEAVKMAESNGCDVIAEIDGGYDNDGNQTADPICVDEYFSGKDF